MELPGRPSAPVAGAGSPINDPAYLPVEVIHSLSLGE